MGAGHPPAGADLHRYLLVDADCWVRAGTAELLHFAGYRTLEAGDGRSGLRLAREQCPDLASANHSKSAADATVEAVLEQYIILSDKLA